MKVIHRSDPEYPEAFRTVALGGEEDGALCRDAWKMPEKIYCEGDVSLLNAPAVAVVGSRKASPYGMHVAAALGRRAASSGAAVVSGMAQGIDSAAQRAAVDAGGKVIAVFGCGTDICYPRENRKLMKQIAESGLIISEYPPGTKPAPFRFPQRNRLISALAEVVVIVEAAVESGALKTAYYAIDQGKKLLAVPGNITSAVSMGTNKLIEDSVPPMISIDTPFESLRLEGKLQERRDLGGLGEEEREVYSLLESHGELTSEQIGILSGLSPMRVGQIITILEMKGFAANYMGRTMLLDPGQTV